VMTVTNCSKCLDIINLVVLILVFPPLSEMFGYIGSLRTMTSGRGQFSMEFAHYNPCPANVAEEVIAEAKARKEAKAK